MKIDSFLSFWSGDLVVKKTEYGTIMVVDEFRVNDADYDYGVFTTLEDIDILELKRELSFLDLIPDLYYEGQVDFLINDDLPNHYGLTKPQVESIKESIDMLGFACIADELSMIDCKVDYSFLKEICDVLKGEEALDFSDIDYGEDIVLIEERD